MQLIAAATVHGEQTPMNGMVVVVGGCGMHARILTYLELGILAAAAGSSIFGHRRRSRRKREKGRSAEVDAANSMAGMVQAGRHP